MAEPAPDDLSLSPGGTISYGDGIAVAEPATYLFRLVASTKPEPPAKLFWQRFTREFLVAMCRAGTLEAAAPIVSAENFLASKPPTRGMEFLSSKALDTLWQALREEISRRCRMENSSLAEVLQQIHPACRIAGRVTLHLAENKNDQDFPFAFLATYSTGINAQGQPRYAPLGKALRDAAEKDPDQLRKLLEPAAAAARRCAWLGELLESKRLFQALAWKPAEAYEMLRDLPLLEECGLIVRVPDWWEPRKPPRPAITVALDPTKSGAGMGAGALLAFKLGASVDGQALTEAEIRQLERTRAPLVSLKGRWVEVDREKWHQALEHWRRVEQANAQGIPFHLALRWMAGFPLGQDGAPAAAQIGGADSWVKASAGPEFANFLTAFRERASLHADQPPGLQATLRPYQKEGVAWLHFLSQLGIGACLADDMGLGKTLQVIALLLLRRGASSSPSLLVAPASLLGNWKAELQRFAPGMPFCILHRCSMSAASLEKCAANAQAGELLITTYAMLERIPQLLSRQFDCAILDEAQAIKTATTAVAMTTKRIQATCRIALTGTPVENRLEDLWSIFDFLNPGLLGTLTEFTGSIRTMARSPDGFAPLRKLVQPFILRRMKSDPAIAPDLPDKTEVQAWCFLTKRQAALYQRAVTALARELAAGESAQSQGAVLGALLKLKQICDHPSLWSGDGNFAPEDSGKFSRLAEIAIAVRDRQEKMLVFTQFKEMTAPLASFLAGIFQHAGLVLHGGTPLQQRTDSVAAFQHESGPSFFVISLKAGGAGLNLTAASHVVHFDRWWNSSVENQATDRAFRIGQRRNVLVHKFITTGTLEEKIDRLILSKQQLAEDILQSSGDIAKSLLQLPTAELLELLQLDGEAAGPSSLGQSESAIR